MFTSFVIISLVLRTFISCVFSIQNKLNELFENFMTTSKYLTEEAYLNTVNK